MFAILRFFWFFLDDKEKKNIGSKESVILDIYQQFACVHGDPVFFESLCKELQKKFFQQRCELGRIGRWNINQRLDFDIPHNNIFFDRNYGKQILNNQQENKYKILLKVNKKI